MIITEYEYNHFLKVSTSAIMKSKILNFIIGKGYISTIEDLKEYNKAFSFIVNTFENGLQSCNLSDFKL